jgi:signal transduction histidine kinase
MRGDLTNPGRRRPRTRSGCPRAWVRAQAVPPGFLGLQRLVEDLQDLAVAESGHLTLDLKPVDLRTEVETAVRSLLDAGAVAIEIDSDRLPAVIADPERLRQILRNLLANALRHAGGDARIRVTGAAAGDHVEVAVEDDGPGIPAEHRQLVFERFHRVEPSRRRRPGGSGLGLAIVRHLVQARGGTVRAEDAPGGGARLVLTLPRAP